MKAAKSCQNIKVHTVLGMNSEEILAMLVYVVYMYVRSIPHGP